jgi:diguanylate cyclase
MGAAGRAWQETVTDDLFDRIGAFLADHGLAADPEHYAFAYSVLSSPDSPMAREVGRLTDDGIRLTRAAIESLGGQAVAGVPVAATKPARAAASAPVEAPQDQAERLVAETQMQVDGFADMMRSMQDETRGFGRDLALSAAAMVHARTAVDLPPGVREIARIVATMIDRVRESEAKLDRATAETDALRTKLAEARQSARLDPLTGLANRLAFAEAFATRRPADAPHCVALCDIDRFKRINDEHGHGVGDRVLKAIATSLADVCEGHVVARHGGEEFTLLIGGMGLIEATRLLERARSQVAGRRLRDRETNAIIGTVTFSAGISAVRPGDTVDMAIERADRLLYAAKGQGRDQICAG